MDNLYALSKMLSVPMDRLIIGTDDSEKRLIIGTDDSEKAEPVKKRSKHLLYYGKMVSERIAA